MAVWAGDLVDTAGYPVLLAALAESIGTPDVALVAWGTLTDQARAEAELAYAARELKINFVAPAALLLALARPMAERRQGVIACITSVAGERAEAISSTVAPKAACSASSRACAIDCMTRASPCSTFDRAWCAPR